MCSKNVLGLSFFSQHSTLVHSFHWVSHVFLCFFKSLNWVTPTPFFSFPWHWKSMQTCLSVECPMFWICLWLDAAETYLEKLKMKWYYVVFNQSHQEAHWMSHLSKIYVRILLSIGKYTFYVIGYHCFIFSPVVLLFCALLYFSGPSNNCREHYFAYNRSILKFLITCLLLFFWMLNISTILVLQQFY